MAETVWNPLGEIRGAVARGWCTPENAHKDLDVELANAISHEVELYMQGVIEKYREALSPKHLP